MTNAEVIELLGGGKIGGKRFAKLRTRAKHQQVFARCWWLARDEFRPDGFDGLQGDICAGTCQDCSPPSVPSPAPSTP